MSILDDAIREHLELKRAHGADEGELQKLEDEAFGPPQRPDEADPFNEAPTEFLLSPDDAPADAPEIGDEAARSGRRPNIADLQEAPPAEPVTGESDAPAGEAATSEADFGDASAPGEASAPPSGDSLAGPDSGAALFNADEELSPAPDAPPPSPTDAADVPPPPPVDEAPARAGRGRACADRARPAAANEASPPDRRGARRRGPPATDEAPAAPPAEEPVAEHEIVPDAGPDTDERHAIVDQPTQMFDVQTHIDAEAAERPRAASRDPPTRSSSTPPSREPQAAPPAPEDRRPPPELDQQQPLDTRGPDAEVAGHPPTEEESAEFDFFNEQRLSDELDQALEAPLPPTDEHVAMPRYDDAPPRAGRDLRLRVGSEALRGGPLRRSAAPPRRARAGVGGVRAALRGIRAAVGGSPARRRRARLGGIRSDYDPDTGHEDVLEDTPRFLEDAPEDDDLWFEQKPPKDFDLD